MSKRSFNPSQTKAILHADSDILISAGAGSGKTATLTERIIRKILSGKDISNMLIVTFTKEAANDLKNKIQKSIVERMKTATDKEKEHLYSQIVKIGSADISTIHSFCLKIIRPNFVSLPIDSGFRIGEENEIDFIKNEVMKDVIEEFYESETPSEEFLIVSDCFSTISNADSLAKKLLTLYDKLSSTQLFLDTLLVSKSYSNDFMESGFGKMLNEEIMQFSEHYLKTYENIIEEIKAIDADAPYLDAFLKDYDFLVRLSNAATHCLNYQSFKDIFEAYSADTLRGIGKGTIENVEVVKKIRDKFKAKIKTYKEYFSTTNDSLYHALSQNTVICEAMYKILSKFNDEFIKRKHKYGVCDFNDIERYAYKLLCQPNGEPTSLAREIAEEYDEIYIDEYQDTNSLQDAIFASISRKNRFMVGDIKQSIYRFRSAEPEIFSHYRTIFEDVTKKDDKGTNGKTIFMSSNYRCDKNVIDLTNAVSDYMFLNSDGIPYQADDRLEFKKIYEGEISPQKSEICLIDRSAFSPDLSHEEIQAKYVAKRIYDMIGTEKLPSGEIITPSHIAILLRKGKHKSYYINALNELGINAEYVDNVKFFEKPHILLLLSLLNTIDNPYNDTYLAGALYSSVFGFSFDDLLLIKKKSQKDVPLYTALLSFEGNDEIVKKIEHFKKKLSLMQSEVKKMNAYESVSYVMNTCGLISATKKTERKDLIKFYNHAREYEGTSYKGLYKFLIYIESIKNSTSKDGAFASSADSIRIMSVHASKGLEFEICFLSNLETGFSDQDTREPILFERHLGIASYVGNPGSLIKYNTLIRKSVGLAIKKATKDEEMRVLYVALTRARTKVILTATMENAYKELSLIKGLSKYVSKHYVYSHDSHIDYILNTYYTKKPDVDFKIIDSYEEIAVDGNTITSEESLDLDKVSELRKTLKERFDFKYQYDYLNKIPSKVSVSRLKPNLLDGTENDEIDLSKELSLKPKFLSSEESVITGADRGTATHLFMQFCDFDNLEKNGYENELKRMLDYSFISESDADIINKAHIELFRNSSLFNMMKGAKMIKREFRFNVMIDAGEFTSDVELKKQKILVQGVIDAVFEDANGKLILVDYKTDKVTENNYEAVLKERYTNQLSYYKKAIELIFEKPLDKVLIYSVPLAKTVEIK
ncbi:MAG: hypothetical protein E7602_05700 [Ruminococcaceae bacterium]|nr:hypothetical protein [Oscillospiraceae bacterium]